MSLLTLPHRYEVTPYVDVKQVSDKDLYGPFGCGFWGKERAEGSNACIAPPGGDAAAAGNDDGGVRDGFVDGGGGGRGSDSGGGGAGGVDSGLQVITLGTPGSPRAARSSFSRSPVGSSTPLRELLL